MKTWAVENLSAVSSSFLVPDTNIIRTEYLVSNVSANVGEI